MADKITGEQIARLLLDKADQSGPLNSVARTIADVVLNAHRTLQQGVIGILFAILKEIGDAASMGDIPTDLRNQASIAACKRLVELEEAGELNTRFPLV